MVLDALSSKCPSDIYMNQLGSLDIWRVFDSLCYRDKPVKRLRRTCKRDGRKSSRGWYEASKGRHFKKKGVVNIFSAAERRGCVSREACLGFFTYLRYKGLEYVFESDTIEEK